MTIKKAIGIGLLGATIIGLVTFGIKTNSFNKENLKPKTLTRTTKPIRVNADGEVTPTSLNWLLKETINKSTFPGGQEFHSNIIYSARNGSSGVSLNKTTTLRARYHNQLLQYYNVNTTYIENWQYVYDTNWNISNINTSYMPNSPYNTNTARIMRFDNAPTGNLYTWLLNNATPYWNNNVIITNKSPAIHQIRKANVIIQDGAFINTEGTIQVLLDNAINKCYVNGTLITNFNTPLNIQNEDIAIQCDGNFTNQVGYVLTINYTNTLPPIEPTPIPDPTNPIHEIIDIRGLMLQILTMPFTFITQAFDVTLWPNTQYEFNIGNFIMSIIAIASILFIIKLFTSGFSIIGNYTGSRVDTKLKKSQIEYNKAKTDLARRTDPNTKTRINKKEK